MLSRKLMPYLGREYRVQTPGEVNWSHAVNSVAKLKRSIEDPQIMFIESDIRMSPQGKVVCVHPPEVESDLTIEYLLEQMKKSKQGLKLDFKDPQTVSPTLTLLKDAVLKQPVMLNADILQGSGANPSKFDPNEFISQCQENYPEGVLSLGWTTTNSPEFPYIGEQVSQMINLTAEIDEMTFPVRACLLPGSWDALGKLLHEEGRTFTVWNNEPVSAELLAWIRENTDPAKTFYDFIDDNKDPLKLL